MANVDRLTALRRRYHHLADRNDLPFLLDLVDEFRSVLGNMVAEYDKQPEPRPDFEAYVLAHARWLTGPRASTLDTEMLQKLFNVPPQA